MDMHVAVLVLAAGFSTRMKAFKPLLPFGWGTSVLGHVVGLWQARDVHDIVVVCGHRADEVAWEAQRLGCSFVRNPKPERGMFSSVQTGLDFLLGRDGPAVSHVAVHPVDIPLIAPATLTRLLTLAADHPDAVLVPRFGAQGGHPPLLPRASLAGVLAWDGPEGLRGALEHEATILVDVDDEHLNTDMDTPEQYRNALKTLYDNPGLCHF